MTIAIDARIINSTTGRYIERLIHYLEELDHENTYLILVRTKDLDYYKPTNPNFRVVEADFANYSFAEQFAFNRFLRTLKQDLVHFCMPQQPLLYTRPAVTTVHDLNLLRITANDDMNWLELQIKKTIFAILLFVVSWRTRHVIAISEYTKKDLMRFSHIPSSKVTVTLEGADKATAQPKAVASLQNTPFLLYVGRAEPYKNNRGLIEAHQQLLAAYPDLRLVIVGKKDTLREADMQWVSKHGYKQVDFLGFVSDEELAWLYRNCRAYVMPSKMEGFGLPGLEAMAYGAPVLSSNTTCSPEIYGDAARYFDPNDTSDMARTIADLLADESARQELIQKGSGQIKKYSWQRMAEQTFHIYKQVLAKSPKTD